MRRGILLVILSVACVGVAAAQPEKKGESRPPYQRRLQGDDARKAAELAETIREREQANQYAEAVRAAEELLALRQRAQGADHHEAVGAKWWLAALQKVAVLPAEQRAAWWAAVQGGDAAKQLEARGQYSQALLLQQKLLDLRRRVLGEDHPHTATSYNNVAMNLAYQGRHAQAEPLFRKALDIRRRVLSEDHPHTAQSYDNVAGNLEAQGKSAQAEPLFRKALELRRRLGRAARYHVADSFAWPAVTRATIAAYRAALGIEAPEPAPLEAVA